MDSAVVRESSSEFFSNYPSWTGSCISGFYLLIYWSFIDNLFSFIVVSLFFFISVNLIFLCIFSFDIPSRLSWVPVANKSPFLLILLFTPYLPPPLFLLRFSSSSSSPPHPPSHYYYYYSSIILNLFLNLLILTLYYWTPANILFFLFHLLLFLPPSLSLIVSRLPLLFSTSHLLPSIIFIMIIRFYKGHKNRHTSVTFWFWRRKKSNNQTQNQVPLTLDICQ